MTTTCDGPGTVAYPECGRGTAVVLNTYHSVRYRRRAAEGKCTLTEYKAVENKPS